MAWWHRTRPYACSHDSLVFYSSLEHKFPVITIIGKHAIPSARAVGKPFRKMLPSLDSNWIPSSERLRIGAKVVGFS